MNQIGRYQIESELGRGGMATVYLAHDPRIDRKVAIKVLPPAFLHDPSFRARFEREARTIATLEHSAIVPVHDFGEENGQLYLVMRFMPGGSLGDRLKAGGPLPLAEVAHITGRLASALDEAHGRDIIHRDLKPDNILFDRHNEPYLSDFGIVKVAESSMAYTGSMIIGTPAYMSPEQAQGGKEIDGRSDIYALGVILFEMLTGQAPYQADTPMQLAMKHILDPVPSILAHKADLPPGLEPILARALAKDPADRYRTAGELAAAVATVASGKGAAATQLLSQQSAVGSKQSAVGSQQSGAYASRSTFHALRSSLPALPWWGWLLGSIVVVGLFFSWIVEPVEPTPPPPLTPTATRRPTNTPPPTQSIIIVRTRTPLPPITITTLDEFRILRGHTDFVNSVAWSPVTTLLASGSRDGEVRIWDGLGGQTMLELDGHANSVNSVAWSADGRLLASGSDDTTAKIWDSGSGADITALQSASAVNSLSWSPDNVSNGRQLVLGNEDGTLEVWDVDSNRQLQVFTASDDPVNSVAWSPDGLLIASGTADSFVQVWDAAGGDLLLALDSHASAVTSVAWSADSRFLASGGADGTIQIWDAANGQQLRLLEGHDRFVNGVAWAPDSQHLVSAGGDQTIRVWDALSGVLLSTIEAHLDTVTEVAWSADGQLVASSSRDQFIKTWRVNN